MFRALENKRQNIIQLLCSCLMVLFGAPAAFAADQATVPSKPNIVMVLVDDSALMDFGIYGGEASTPHIDALAKRGAMFTQYRTSPLCAPTRAMLLTGIDNHRTGVATIPEVLPPEHVGKPGYSMALEPGVLTIADRLRAVGYRTMMSGKWHMGDGKGELPNHHGFDRSLALAASGADNWEDKSYMPYYADAPWFEDGKAFDVPDDYYSSRFHVDNMMRYLKDSDPSKPFFAYLPFQAIHIPVQAPAEFIAKYAGKFDQGWHVMRKARHERAQELGLIPQGAPLAPMPAGSRDWESLSDEERATYAARMEVNAAMLEAMDHHIGRFIAYLKKTGTYDNTIFVITSDNGPEPNRGDNSKILTTWMRFNDYHIDRKGVGARGSWGFIGPEWANAAASPGDLFKFYGSEGGLRVPLIMAGPGIDPQTIAAPAMVTDVTPTILAILGEDASADSPVGITGRSLLPVLTGEAQTVYGPDDIRAIEVSGNSALYKGEYKITRNMPPNGNGKWRLFDISKDPGETNDLALSKPEILKDLLAEFDQYSADMGVQEIPEGYDPATQIFKNIGARLGARYKWALIVAALLMLGLIYGLFRIFRRKRKSATA